MKYVYATEDGREFTVDQSIKDDSLKTLSDLAKLLVEQQGNDAIMDFAGNDPESPVKRVITGGSGFIWDF